MIEKGFEFPGSTIPYIVQAREQAKDIIYPPLKDINREYSLGLRFLENPSEVRFPNGSKIRLFGGGTLREIEKFRGMKFPIVAIDEAQSFPAKLIEYMINDVCMPAMADYGLNAQMYLTGTPNAAKAGFFHDQWHKGAGSNHHWTLFDNPHMPDPHAFAAKMRKINSWSEQSATYQREYKGVWVRDETGLVYLLNYMRNVLPGSWDRWKASADDWAFTLGIDVGARSCTAFVLVAHSLDTSQAIVVETQKFGGRQFGKQAKARAVSNARLAAIIEAYRRKYNIHKIVLDTGGQGAAYQLSLSQDHGIFVDAAEKTHKAGYIEALNSDFQAGVLKIPRNSNEPLLDELEVLQWDQDKRDRGSLQEDKSTDNHCCDALLYAWRSGAHHALDWQLEGPKPNSVEFETSQAQKAKEQYAQEMSGSDLEWFEERDEAPGDTGFQDGVILYDQDY